MSSSNRRVLLCLSCSSSPSPTSKDTPFTTPCCGRPICTACLRRTPRLRDYSPCLACLAGVSAVSVSASNASASHMTPSTAQKAREEAMFVLGDSDDELETSAPPAYEVVVNSHSAQGTTTAAAPSSALPSATFEPQEKIATVAEEPSGPPSYHVQRTDTLQGIAFKFGVDGRELCKLNSLPLSTLSTTPHLLHTRRTITLPLNAINLHSLPLPPTAEEDAHRRRERAEKRFQFVTKEVDWRVARTYVALAEDDDVSQDLDFAREDKKTRSPGQPLESRAVDHYLDDDDWERQGGSKKPSIPRFPLKA